MLLCDKKLLFFFLFPFFFIFLVLVIFAYHYFLEKWPKLSRTKFSGRCPFSIRKPINDVSLKVLATASDEREERGGGGGGGGDGFSFFNCMRFSTC